MKVFTSDQLNMSSDQQLCDLLNEFYEDIDRDIFRAVFSAIRAAQIENEFVLRPEIFDNLRRLIINLANPQLNDSVSLNIYATSDSTRGSITLIHLNPLISHLSRAEFFLSPPPISSLLPPLPPLPRDFLPLSLPPLQPLPRDFVLPLSLPPIGQFSPPPPPPSLNI